MPIRQRRKELEQDKEYILSVLKAGTQETLEVAEKTLQDVKSAMQLVYF